MTSACKLRVYAEPLAWAIVLRDCRLARVLPNSLLLMRSPITRSCELMGKTEESRLRGEPLNFASLRRRGEAPKLRVFASAGEAPKFRALAFR